MAKYEPSMAAIRKYPYLDKCIYFNLNDYLDMCKGVDQKRKDYDLLFTVKPKKIKEYY